MSEWNPMSMFDVSGRVAVVTGASSGLGERFARLLHAAGAHVVVAARRADRLEQLANELGDRVTVVECDLAQDDQVERLTDCAVGVNGKVDILVNNAGYGKPMAAEDEPIEHFRYTMAVNVEGLYLLSQGIGRNMLEHRQGSIINIASVLGLVAAAPVKETSYCASKGAVVNLTRELGCHWGRKGVRVNAIAPGWFLSEMTEQEMFDDPAGRAFIDKNTPLGRPGAVDELDGALLYLASDASSYVTGQILAVDGGWTAR